MAHPVVHVYAVCYNEELLLPYFLRHYETIAERIVVFDGASTDRSVEILRDHPKVVLEQGGVEFPTHADRKYNEPVLMKIRNEAYKRSRGEADWVVVVDIDEFLYHPDLRDVLARYKAAEVTFPSLEGFDMVSFGPPSRQGQIYDEIRHGFKNRYYSKKALFNPAIDVNYHFGCHDQDPKGNVHGAEVSEAKLLHYRFLGAELFAEKYLRRQARFHSESLERKWGTHLCVAGKTGPRLVIDISEDDLKKMFWQILSEQEIREVVP